MSDTTAFLTGCAMAGVATLLLFKGGQGFGQLSPNLPLQTQPGTPTITDPNAQTPAANSELPGVELSNSDPQLRAYLEKQKVATEQLMTQLEQQKAETEKLRMQLEQQKVETNQLMALLREQEGSPAAFEQAQNFQTGMIWAVGGVVVVLVVGGSIVLVGLIAIAAQPQRRNPRTTHVFHPVNFPQNPNLQGRHPELFPPQPRTRRVQNIERDDY